MNIEFFLIDNKSGYKTKESWFIKNYPKKYELIISYEHNQNIDSFKEKIWFYFNNLKERPKCKCGNEIKFRNRLDKPYGEYCSLKCANEDKETLINKIKKTNKDKYGVDYFSKHKSFKEKTKQTKLEKYGDENFNNHKKSKETKLEKYGDENFNNHKKSKETNLKIYGVDNPSKSQIIKNKITDTNLERYGFKSPILNKTVLNKRISTNLKKMSQRFADGEFLNYDFSEGEYLLQCNTCLSDYKIQQALVNERKRNNQKTCLNCNPINSKSSTIEDQLGEELLKIYNGVVIKNDRTVISQELDYYIPDKKIAIEFNGLYWHSELFKNERYHLNKTEKCLQHGVNLIHIFEDEWLYKKDIVISILKNKLGLIENKLYARKCVIKEIDNKISDNFLNQNHIQGSGSKNSYRLGLFYNDDLVSVMTFSKGRIAMGGKSNEWELTRFCNKLNTSVIGSGNKLFKFFLNNKTPMKVISYADKRLFSGNIYDLMGFTKTKVNKPNYHYIINNFRYHRFNFRKDVLIKKGFDSNKTEKQIMLERGIYRIYDCGTIRYDWNNHSVI